MHYIIKNGLEISKEVNFILTFSGNIVNSCRRGYSISWFANKKSPELFLILLTAIFPILLFFDQEFLYIINFVLIFSITMILKDYDLRRKKWSYSFKVIFYISITIQIIGNIAKIFFFFYKNVNSSELIPIIMIFTIGVFLYLFVALTCILAAINLLFYIFLKYLFPSELNSELEIAASKQNISMKELSPYMTLNQQILYLIVALSTTTIFSTVAILGTEILGRLLIENDDEMKSLFQFIDFEWFTLANTIGIISVLIALLNITIPLQNKLYYLAYEKYKAR